MPVFGSLSIADTGQAETQEGSAQCMHEVFMKAKPFSSVLRFHRAAAVHLDQVEGLAAGIERRIPQLVDRGELGRIVVGLLASRDAGLAAYAQRCVIKQTESLGRPL
jgi:phage-related minor tail protein